MADQALDQMVRVVRAHHRQILTLRATLANAVGIAWDRFANVDEASAQMFLEVTAPVVVGAIAATGTLADALYQNLDEVNGQQSPVTRSATSPVIRNGIPTAEVYRRSIVTARTALARPQPARWVEAMAAGRARAVSTAATDVMLGNRAAMGEAGARRPWIVGYRRVLTGKSCNRCALASTQRYKSGDLAPLHNRCDCDIAPIYGDRDPGHVIDRPRLDQLNRAESAGTAPRVVEVREHGEMGPVLIEPGAKFTGPGDLGA